MLHAHHGHVCCIPVAVVLLVFFLGPRLMMQLPRTTLLVSVAEGNEDMVEAGRELAQGMLLFFGQSWSRDHAQL